jgi:hypothetical protein
VKTAELHPATTNVSASTGLKKKEEIKEVKANPFDEIDEVTPQDAGGEEEEQEEEELKE